MSSDKEFNKNSTTSSEKFISSILSLEKQGFKEKTSFSNFMNFTFSIIKEVILWELPIAYNILSKSLLLINPSFSQTKENNKP